MKHHLIPAIIMALFLVPSIARSYDFEAVNDDGVTLYYDILSEEEKTCEVTIGIEEDYSQIIYTGDIVLPSTANGYKVTSISGGAFSYSDITSITISNTVTTINDFTFQNCTKLKYVNIGDGVETLGAFVFQNCEALETLIIGKSLNAVHSTAFYDCNFSNLEINTPIIDGECCVSSLKTVTLGDNVKEISEYAFKGCNSLTTINISNSVTVIKDYAFEGCSGLTSVTFGNNVTSIGMNAFYDCTGLTSIKIPSSVTSIGAYAFSNCTGLASIEIPSSVTDIGSAAFYDCKKLPSFRIPESLTRISDHMFSGCTMLSTIFIPSSVEYIDEHAFQGCDNLKKVVIENIASWCNIAFYQMYDFSSNPLKLGTCTLYSDENTEITNLIIPNTVKTINKEVFYGCKGLTSVEIPNSVTTIGKSAFSGCSGLPTINIPSSVTTIGDGAFNGCTQLETILIPNSVDVLGNKAFDGTAWYTAQSDGLVYAGKNAYKYKGTMAEGTSIVIEDGTRRICDELFKGCNNLTSVTIPNSVKSIGEDAFSVCTNLSTVYSEITDFFDISKSVFQGSENTTLYVPKGMATTYRSSTGWSVIKYIEEMPDDTPDAPFLISCSNRGSVSINGAPSITNKIAASDINEGTDNTFTFTPKPNCKLDQVILNGLDITANVQNNTLTCTIPANSQMIVTFTTEQGDMNNDGTLDISDVVSIVNKILGN